jgi:hypothetical protein
LFELPAEELLVPFEFAVPEFCSNAKKSESEVLLDPGRPKGLLALRERRQCGLRGIAGKGGVLIGLQVLDQCG